MKPTSNLQRRDGFALVVTISMMVLLVVVVVATLSLSTVTLRSVDRDSAQAIARANARMALMLAIGHLQKEAGPDQRVTGTAEIIGSEANPYWTGVWRAGIENKNSQPTWLVSGSNPDPENTLDDANSAVLARPPSSEPGRKELRAEYVTVQGKQLDGRYAYWVGDEGTKVRIDLGNPEKVTGYERVGRSQSPREPGFAAFDRKHRNMWAGFDSDYNDSVDRRTLVSMGTVALAAKDSGDLDRDEIPKYYFNDLTTGGFGLPVNVRDGGMKKDLSLLLDRSQQNQNFVSDFFGGKPTLVPNGTLGHVSGTVVYNFGTNPDRTKFTLSPTITNSYSNGFVGPNWGILYNYARLWETVQGSTSPMIGLNPRVDSNLRQPNWLPYREFYKGQGFQEDIQHTNSGLSPVMAMSQLGFSLKTDIIGSMPPPARTPVYGVTMMYKPLVGLWNPYNVHIQASIYQLEWASGPFVRLKSDVVTPYIDPDGVNVSPQEITICLREYWHVQSDGMFPIDGNGGGSYFRVRTPSATFQPGEFRLFSVAGNPPIQTSSTLSDQWDADGGYSIPLRIDNPGSNPVRIHDSKRLQYPSGTRLTVEYMTLQDTHPAVVVMTAARFPNIDLKAASTWYTLKAGPKIETHLNRYTDIWNGGKNGTAQIAIPEPVTKLADDMPSFSVDQLTFPQHIATWRFYTRNSTEAEGSQGLRGWIDANPRVMTNNFRFDGSRNEQGNMQGWNFSSNLLGGRSSSSMGDGQGGSRGLVAQFDQRGGQMPDSEGGRDGKRWRGLTGPASTSTEGGLPNVVVYDVPQAPLTSIGQFQHANLSRYGFEPGFVVGNSYANTRIPLNNIVKTNFGNMGFNVVDISYEANNKLWDTVFFSTLAPDYKGGGSSFDRAFDRNALLLRTKSLPNPRMVYTELPGDESIDKIISDAGDNAPQTISTRIMIEGAFNVNSTSKLAWKAILSTMDGSEIPVIDLGAPADPKYVDPKGIRFSRFNHVVDPSGYTGGARKTAFWQGWREITDDELDLLAEEIVKEVKSRGPFRSMAEFVNRNPYSSDRDHQVKGALQAAIDSSVNKSIDGSVGLTAANPQGSNFASNVVTGENQTAGHAAYLMQGDILQCLAPVMQVRSDYFRIRTCGEALDKTGKVVARVWCEAFIQRMPDYVDPADAPEAPFDDPTPSNPFAKDDLRSDINVEFGRRMKMISFRWLNPNEI
ncbi:hypothetical protein OVA24_15580 [Luteolibacter sp. SL250]|uniref:hypothetical protein n=1 Tax=Luteolibacter sp. SL250 TaxID=2995170 RepID=UPI002270626C|nr:hypothetical protein [Luteolibacter sp. SL250]WAC18653.1 hypothetical protein OVA24_15580 [Luteolibacter sp. SL250]